MTESRWANGRTGGTQSKAGVDMSGGARPKAGEAETCRHSAKGRCMRVDACRFAHPHPQCHREYLRSCCWSLGQLPVYFLSTSAGFFYGSPPATRRHGGYRETLAGGQPGLPRRRPPRHLQRPPAAAAPAGAVTLAGSHSEVLRGKVQLVVSKVRAVQNACKLRA